MFAALLSGCAHRHELRPRAARTLAVVGSALFVIGGVTAAGCADVHEGLGGCSGGPEDADLAAGFPIMAAGGALIGTAILMRPRSSASLVPGATPKAPPVMPDPFVKPLNPNP